ncbi:MAG: histidine kinase [Oscillospiraceae bacterium]|nr:histidine kinase [Oscillospiraceae bacterium]
MKKIMTWFRSGVPFHVLLTSFAVGLSLCSILIIGFTFYSTASGFLEDHADTLAEKQLTQAVTALGEELSALESAAHMTANDAFLRKNLTTYQTTGQLSITLFEGLSEAIQREHVKARSMVNEIEALLLLTDYGTISSENTLLPSMTQKTFSEYFGWELGVASFYLPEQVDIPHHTSYWSEDFSYYEQYVLYSHPIVVGSRTIGTLCYVVSPELINACLEPHISAAVCQDAERIIYNTTELDSETVLQNVEEVNTDTTPSRIHLTQYDLTILHVPNDSTLKQSLQSLRRICLLMGLVVIAISFGVSLLFSKLLTRPLVKIQEAMEQINSKATLKRKFFRGKVSSRNYIWIYLSTIVFVSAFLFSFISYRVFLNASNNILLTTAEVSFQQSLDSTSSAISNLYHTSFNLSYDNQIQEELSDRADSYVQDPFPTDFFQQNLSLYTLPVNLRVFDTKLNPLYSTDYFIDQESSLSQTITRRAQWKALQSGSQNMLEMSLEIVELNDFRTLGYLILQADELYISQTYDYFPGDQHQVYLHTPDGTILSSNDKTMIGAQLPAPAEDATTFSSGLSNIDLILTTYYSTSALRDELLVAVRSMIYFFLFLLLAVFISNIFISGYLSKQFRLLGDTFEDFSLSNPTDFSQKYSAVSEINRTYEAFDQMQQRILVLMDDILKGETQRYSLELEKQHMQMQLLHSQINPHFLYNTFEAINSMIANGDAAAGMRTLNALADMLRYTTKVNTMQVPFSEELQHAKLYLNVMTIHSRQLSVHYDISPEVYELQTVRFILQPILENAIHHGLKQNGGIGTIHIIAKVANNKLIVVVRDDGAGMDAQTLQQLKLSLMDTQAQASIGLPNIANRLRLSHGAAGRLLIDSEEGMGCAVTIIQPISSDVYSETNNTINKEKEI